jgi:hypothetical protein
MAKYQMTEFEGSSEDWKRKKGTLREESVYLLV